MSQSRAEPYHILRRWELKRSDLTTTERREARAILFGSFRQTSCYFSHLLIPPRLLQTGAVDVHHLLPRGSPGCNLLPNLRLAFHGFNANEGKPGVRKRDKDRFPVDPTLQLRQVVDYSLGSKEMQANNEAEPEFRAWMWARMRRERRVPKKDAISGGAEQIGVSKQATRDYLDKMTSSVGPFREVKVRGHGTLVVLKAGARLPEGESA